MPRIILSFTLIFLLFAAPTLAQEASQATPCGLVDELRDPLEPLTLRYDDFGIFRARFGGQHVGLDIGFGENAVGAPVFATARGQVTYADPYGWDTEGGVIVLAHRFPDGSHAYSLYGHIVPEGETFPAVGRCVEAGTVLARIGIPTLSAPHLHFEFRDFLPDSGGPGYVPGNPLEAGWFHPLDFAAAWRLRLNLLARDGTSRPQEARDGTSRPQEARAAYHSPQAPSLPPVLLPDGQLVLASGNTLLSLTPMNQLRWRLQSDSSLLSLAALPDGSVVASSYAGQLLVVRGGRYLSIWAAREAAGGLPPVVLGERLIFASEDGTLSAHSPSGDLLWQSEPLENARPVALEASEHTIALLVEDAAGARLQLFADDDGRLLGEWSFSTLPLLAARPSGGWWLYDGASLSLLTVAAGEWRLEVRATVDAVNAPDRAAQLHALADGGAVLFTGEGEAMMIAFAADGRRRWEQPYPSLSHRSPPLLASAADSCWLAALAADGTLLLLSGADGQPLREAPWPGALYPGGQRQRQPAARLLQRQGDTLLVGAGFLSVLALDLATAPAELRCGAGE